MAFLLFFIAYAQSPELEPAITLLQRIAFFILNPIISLFFGVAFVFFLWGIVEYVWQSGSEEARSKGRRHIAWGLVGMVIMFAAFTIVEIVANTVGSNVDLKAFRP